MISIGDIMFYFFIEIMISLIILFLAYSLFNRKEINVLEIIILLLIFNVCIFSLYKELNILYTIFLSFLILVIYYLYLFLRDKTLNKKLNLEDKVLINRGIVNFQELIKENYSYENLMFNLKKRGINNPSLVDYCIKKDNDLIIFRKNSIKNYPISIIVDGKVLRDNLISINKSYEWLIKKLNDNDLDLKDINYAYYKNKDVFFVVN